VRLGRPPASLSRDRQADRDHVEQLLMRHQGEVLTRASLGQRLGRNEGNINLVNLVDVHISHLRKKIDREPLESLIHTVRGRGYRLGTLV
jgi:two-component system OmpR family response regulator